MRPLARTDGLVVRDLADETIVYDRERHQAHCLNRTAASVFRLCDGQRDAGEIVSMLDEPPDPRAREALVAAALGRLAEAHLLAGAGGAPIAPRAAAQAESADFRRRELLRRVGTALLVPAIASIVAPTPAQAASACINEMDCDPFTNAGQRCDPNNTGDCSAITPFCCSPLTPGVCNDLSC